MYCPCNTLFFHFFFRDSPNLAFMCCIPSCFASLFSLGWLNSSVIFIIIIIIIIILAAWSSAWIWYQPRHNIKKEGFGFLPAVLLRIQVFWDVTLCFSTFRRILLPSSSRVSISVFEPPIKQHSLRSTRLESTNIKHFSGIKCSWIFCAGIESDSLWAGRSGEIVPVGRLVACSILILPLAFPLTL